MRVVDLFVLQDKMWERHANLILIQFVFAFCMSMSWVNIIFLMVFAGICSCRCRELHLVAWLSSILMRPGHVVLFTLPCDSKDAKIELGMLMTVWRGIKQPRPHSGEVNVASCVAFRAVQLEMVDQDCKGKKVPLPHSNPQSHLSGDIRRYMHIYGHIWTYMDNFYEIFMN